LSRSSEVSGSKTSEEDEKVPGRVFNLLGDLGGGESGEQEEVHEDRLKVPHIEISRPEDFEQLWDCPACNYVNHVSEFQCPQCSFNRNTVEQAVMEFYMQIDNSGLKPQEHVAYLNGLIMLKTGNSNWHKLVISYMEEYNLKSEDMEGLMGPKPWEEAIMESEHGVETVEVPATNAELTAALQDQKGTEPEDPLSALGKSLRTKAELKAEQVEATEADIKSAFEEKVAEIADSDPRARVIVSDEVGWLCEECNRVWSLELKHCTVCNKEYAAEVEKKEEADADKSKSDLDVLKDKLGALGTTLEVQTEAGKTDLYAEVKSMEGMKTAEKARLMLLLKEKEKLGDKTPFEDLQQRYPDEFADEKEETDDNREEAPTTPIL
jgi:RNA polymerase subunit RPABC4/transcription elongation factor Spt4